jgi:hypothetical protein
MLEETKALLRLSWAQSLFGVQQLANALRRPVAGRDHGVASAAFDSVSWAAQEQLGGGLRPVYVLGDMLQRSAVDATFNLMTGATLTNPGLTIRQGAGLLRQAAAVMRFLASGQDARLAWQEFQQKLQVFAWVRNVEAVLGLPADGSYVAPEELVRRAYALDAFPALWAVEGAGHYYAASAWVGDGDPHGLLTDGRTAAAPAKSLTMLHAGIGLAFAERLLKKVTTASQREEVRETLRRFLQLCRANSRAGYVGAALESLGLVARVFHSRELVAVLDRELAPLDEEALGCFWHGVGRGIYFSPTYFLPFAGEPWPAVQMCRGEAPHQTGRLNALAGLTWAMTLVNMREPAVMEAVVCQHGEELLPDGAFANGVSSAIVMRYDTTPEAPFLGAFCRHVPTDEAVRSLWDRLVRGPCEEAINQRHGALKKAGRLGEVFGYQPNSSHGRGGAAR